MIVDQNLPQKIETKLGGAYNIESVVNDDGTQTLNITSAEKAFDRLQWKCDNLKTLYHEFREFNGESLNEVLNGLDTSQVTNTAYMFYKNANLKEVQLFDTSNVTDMSYMFYGTTLLSKIPLYDTSKVTTMKYMFAGSYDGSGKSPKIVPAFDTSNVTDMSYMFYLLGNTTQIPMLNTSKVTNMEYMFYGDYDLEEVPDWDTSNVTNMRYMFYTTSLKKVPNWNLSNLTNSEYMFYGTDIEVFPAINMPKLTNIQNMLRNCASLTTIEKLDLLNVTATGGFIDNCPNLINLTVTNVKKNLGIGQGSSGSSLSLNSVINTIKELWDYSSGTTTYKLIMSNASKNLLADVYVKLITPTEEMITNDPYIESKMPCEVCESTDEGAMLITDYATLKKWTIATYW